MLLLSVIALCFISCNFPICDGQECPGVTSDNLKNPCQIQSDSVIISYENVTVQCNEMKLLTHYSSKQDPPVTFTKAQMGKSYMLAMVDPNAPNSAGAYFLHWLVSDIRGEDFARGTLGNTARVLTGYRPPGPPPNTGVHAYQFFIFELSGTGAATEAPSQRPKFDLVQFANANDLCAPVAATQFRTQAL